MKHKATTLALAALMAVSASAFAGEKEDATKLVNEAATAIAANKSAAVAEIGKAGGKYVKGEIYVFAYDLEGVMVAHPVNPKLVGKSLIDVPDANGKMFRKDIIEGVKSKGSTTVDYKYKNPTSGAIEDKATFCLKAADLAVCAGYYK